MLDDNDVFVDEYSLRTSNELLEIVRGYIRKSKNYQWLKAVFIGNQHIIDRCLRIMMNIPS